MTRDEFFEYGAQFATAYDKTIAGTGKQMADVLEDAFIKTGERGGFMLGHTVALRHDLNGIVDFLVPELQRRGRFRTEYHGQTLRENLADDT
jgi:alkanesulfonate monooxygenase SsuD/methylene tetrahydromethanopterin reductase-like flavin-dependent oxidoreductase (luciferase family)